MRALNSKFLFVRHLQRLNKCTFTAQVQHQQRYLYILSENLKYKINAAVLTAESQEINK